MVNGQDSIVCWSSHNLARGFSTRKAILTRILNSHSFSMSVLYSSIQVSSTVLCSQEMNYEECQTGQPITASYYEMAGAATRLLHDARDLRASCSCLPQSSQHTIHVMSVAPRNFPNVAASNLRSGRRRGVGQPPTILPPGGHTTSGQGKGTALTLLASTQVVAWLPVEEGTKRGGQFPGCFIGGARSIVVQNLPNRRRHCEKGCCKT